MEVTVQCGMKHKNETHEKERAAARAAADTASSAYDERCESLYFLIRYEQAYTHTQTHTGIYVCNAYVHTPSRPIPIITAAPRCTSSVWELEK